MDKITVASPTRVDFAGGTLDCWPVFALLGQAHTVNLAIDIKTQAQLERFKNSKEIQIESDHLANSCHYEDLQGFLADQEPGLKFFREIIKAFEPSFGFRLKTSSQSPVGGGLGGSSSLMASIAKAFSHLQNRKWQLHPLIRTLSSIEARVLWAPTGLQDYYPAITGGLNILRFSDTGVDIDNLDFPESVWSSHFSLFYTGHAHHSGLNNWQLLKQFIEGDKSTVQAFQEINEIAFQTVELCRAQRWQNLPEVFDRELSVRQKLASGYVSEEIEEIRQVALSAGARAVKVCGAGGGGCVVVWSDANQKAQVDEKCQESGFKLLTARPAAFQKDLN